MATVTNKTTVTTLTLTISGEEAQALATVLSLVGGCPHSSPRRHTHAVWGALCEAGITQLDESALDPSAANKGTVYFR